MNLFEQQALRIVIFCFLQFSLFFVIKHWDVFHVSFSKVFSVHQFQEGKQSIIATSYDDDKHGVPAIFDKIYFKELLQLNDDNGAKHLLKKYKYHIKVLIPPAKNVDLDFKKDYLKFYKTYFKKWAI